MLKTVCAICLGLAAPLSANARHSPVASLAPSGFLENRGQLSSPACFYLIGSSSAAYFEPQSVVLDRRPKAAEDNGAVVRIQFPGSSAPRLESRSALAERVNVLQGSDPKGWHRGLRRWAQVRYRGIAPGADAVYYVKNGRLEYDVVLAAGADLSRVRLRYAGVEKLELGPDGSLYLHTAAGVLREEPPHLYQPRSGDRVPVQGGYRLLADREIGFWASGNDPSLPLVVDPALVWSTFIGGSQGDNAYDVKVDRFGDVYLVGSSSSPDYPTTSGAYRRTKAAASDVVITKLRADGTGTVWSTFLGGAGSEDARALALGPNGEVYVTGYTTSTDFPVTAGAFRTSPGGGYEGFATKLSPAGDALTYSTYVGGNWDDVPRAIGVDGSGRAVIAGFTSSNDFPTTSGVVKPTRNPVFPDGADGFITKLNATGTGLVFSTYLGTDGGTDEIFAMSLDGQGRPTVTGWTLSPGFPTTPNAYRRNWVKDREGFVTKLTDVANGFVYSTFFGDSGRDEPAAIVLDTDGSAYVAGRTSSTRFFTTSNAAQRSYGGGAYDAFLIKLSADGSTLPYSTYLGGSGSDAANAVVLVSSGQACMAGSTDSSNWPATSGAFDVTANGGMDACLARIVTTGGPLGHSSYVGSPGVDVAMGLAVQPTGRVIAVGYTDNGGFPVTAGVSDVTQNSPGLPDCFVLAMDVSASGPVAVGSAGGSLFELSPPYPNPFRGVTTAHFTLASPGPITLRVLDPQGRLVRTLVDEELPAGVHSASWDGRDASGHDAGSGMFFLQLKAQGVVVGTSVVRLR